MGMIHAGFSQCAFRNRCAPFTNSASSVLSIVEVVDAMIVCGRAARAMRPSASRLASSVSGTPSKMTGQSAIAASASGLPTT